LLVLGEPCYCVRLITILFFLRHFSASTWNRVYLYIILFVYFDVICSLLRSIVFAHWHLVARDLLRKPIQLSVVLFVRRSDLNWRARLHQAGSQLTVLSGAVHQSARKVMLGLVHSVLWLSGDVGALFNELVKYFEVGSLRFLITFIIFILGFRSSYHLRLI